MKKRCKDCGELFEIRNLVPYRYEISILLCCDCNDQRDKKDEEESDDQEN